MKRISVLLIEDDYDQAFITSKILSKTGLIKDLHIKRTGEEALALLFGVSAKDDSCPDLILLDLNMPEMSGFEVLRLLKLSIKTRGIPVVILTSSNDDEDKRQSYDNGAYRFITKPMDKLKLQQLISDLYE